MKLGSGIMAAANFKHHNGHQQEECCHGKADSIHCQVSHQAVTVIRNMFAEARNLLQLISDTGGKHDSRQDCSQEQEYGVDDSWCSGVLAWGTTGTATKACRRSTTTGSLRKVIECNNNVFKMMRMSYKLSSLPMFISNKNIRDKRTGSGNLHERSCTWAPEGGEGYPYWPIWGGSTWKGCHFQASGI